MITPIEALIGLIAITIIIDLYLVFRPAMARAASGKLLGFIGIFLLPLIICSFSVETHMEASKRTEFCLSCHMMQTHGMSLYVDDKEYIPAVHFQNHRIPKDQACFTCHTTYTMYGDYAAKMKGLQHLYYQYIGTIPDTIHLYEPYNNRECLHCHDGARSFEQQSVHLSTPGLLDSIKRNQMSCLSAGCHDIAHDVKSLPTASFWKPAPEYQPEWMKDTNRMSRELEQIKRDHQFAKKVVAQAGN
jgi:nitrate/TMAO reductase-like tetraheme cytochrome c subunit